MAVVLAADNGDGMRDHRMRARAHHREPHPLLPDELLFNLLDHRHQQIDEALRRVLPVAMDRLDPGGEADEVIEFGAVGGVTAPQDIVDGRTGLIGRLSRGIALQRLGVRTAIADGAQRLARAAAEADAGTTQQPCGAGQAGGDIGDAGLEG
jgi:hypothetical protein